MGLQSTTTGQDVFWTSPTAVTTGLAEYDWSFHITKLEVRVVVLFIPVDVDVTDQLDDAAMGSGTELGLPFVLVNEWIEDPGTGTSADVLIDVDINGFGNASITDVTLGQYNGYNITRIRAEGTASVMGIPQGDYNRDGRVELADYSVWRSEFGATGSHYADGNRDLVVDAADYVVWRRNLGVDTITVAAATAAVPEPSTWTLAALFCGVLVFSRRRSYATEHPKQSWLHNLANSAARWALQRWPYINGNPSDSEELRCRWLL